MLWHLRRDHKVDLLRTFPAVKHHGLQSYFWIGVEMRCNGCCIKNQPRRGRKHVGHVLSLHRSVLRSAGKWCNPQMIDTLFDGKYQRGTVSWFWELHEIAVYVEISNDAHDIPIVNIRFCEEIYWAHHTNNIFTIYIYDTQYIYIYNIYAYIFDICIVFYYFRSGKWFVNFCMPWCVIS